MAPLVSGAAQRRPSPYNWKPTRKNQIVVKADVITIKTPGR
jgi:hypothetical protein